MEALRISALAKRERWILLGEPGSGKSTVMMQAAQAAGTGVVTARALVEGRAPAGAVLFIDALEEYRLGDAPRDRLHDVITALKRGGHTRWRLASRAVSLPPPDLTLLRSEIGPVEVWQLDLLDDGEQVAVLQSLGETEAERLVRRVDEMAAGPLLGNPANLKLLRVSLRADGKPVHTRGELLERATFDMAHEVNPDLPEAADRPPAVDILEAANRACLVLILSAREELWMARTRKPGDHVVTREDLRPADIDFEGLRFAVDTPLFRGEGASFMPTARLVAEFLAGRALADSVNRTDGRHPALPLTRALALLAASDGRPAPALVGTFAWFVTYLADGSYADRALELLKLNPEAILFQGDAALLPARHRAALLEATGRGDPWFLSGMRGSSAVGGLAGEDLASPFEQILLDENEIPHRRGLIVEALAVGRPMPTLIPALQDFLSDPAAPEWVRRRAVTALMRQAGPEALRSICPTLAAEPPETGVKVWLEALEELVPFGVATEEVRLAMRAYGATGDGVMGYAAGLSRALELRPPLDFFEKPFPTHRNSTSSRSIEVSSFSNRLLAACIRSAPELRATDLLRWLANAGFRRHDDPEERVKIEIGAWLDRKTSSAPELFWALDAQAHGDAWRASYEFQRLTGRPVPAAVVEDALKRLEASRPASLERAAELAIDLVGREPVEPRYYWRLWWALESQPTLATLLSRLTTVPVDHWRMRQLEHDRQRKSKVRERSQHDQAWLTAHEAEIRRGEGGRALSYAAEVYAGHHASGAKGERFERVLAWAGAEMADAIEAGWNVLMTSFPVSIVKQGRQEPKQGANYHANHIAAVWLDLQLSRGASSPTLSPEAAIGALRGSYFMPGSEGTSVASVAAQQLLHTTSGRRALTLFWNTALRVPKGVLHGLPYASAFADDARAGDIVESIISGKPDLPGEVLQSALALAASTLPPHRMKILIAAALGGRLPREARILWSFAAFMADPRSYESLLGKLLAGPDGEVLFNRLHSSHLLSSFGLDAESQLVRNTALVRHLGPLYEPSHDFRDRDGFSQVIAGAIAAIAGSPTPAATNAFTDLSSDPKLASWTNLLRHQAAAQSEARRTAEFKAPAPMAVSRALLAGAPATASDLRAVVHEVLTELAADIRNSDTSPWRGFWNYPSKPDRSPKDENDCRDLLADRMRDRLLRFGVRANRVAPEARSSNERRADLLIIGEGDAALPLEAKRHMNREIWSATQSQLAEYAKSARSGGHGVYLIFWFGLQAGAVPARPEGVVINSAQALKAALDMHLPADQQGLIEVVVLDVSPPPLKPKRAIAGKAAATNEALRARRL